MEQAWQFGPYVVWAQRRRLEREGEPVRLGARALDLLLHLLRHAGEVVGKEDILAEVWRGLVVEEGCLRVQMYLLRKALGAPPADCGLSEWIANVPTLGYSFIAPVQRLHEGAAEGAGANAAAVPATPAEGPSLPPAAAPMPGALAFQPPPVRMSALVGREGEKSRVLAALAHHRLVTLVGAAGVGKTSLAIDAVDAFRRANGGDVAFVDLSPLPAGASVVSALVRAMGAPTAPMHAGQWLRQALAHRPVLLLLDNCEQVADTLAPLLMELLAGLPALRVLATSREMLRIGGEYVLRLAPLACPEASAWASLDDVRRYPAVELLHDRMLAAGAVAFDDAHAGQLAAIARQLDGIPLAIELVAGQMATQSLPQLARQLSNHMGLYAAGSRTGVERHRTLAAALDWSLQLLTPQELAAFRQLSVFRAGFDTEAALLVLSAPEGGGGGDPESAQAHLTALVAKSLVALDALEPHTPYRLLDTTRGYAEELLLLQGDREAVRRRHVAWLLDRLALAVDEVAELAPAAWGQRHARLIDDVRAALDWTLSVGGDVPLGVRLTLASSPLWFHLSHVEEYCERLQRAIAALGSMPAADPHAIEPGAMASLQLARGHALWHMFGHSPELMDAFAGALADARLRGDKPLQLQAIFGLCTGNMQKGDYLAGRDQVGQFHAVAATLPLPAIEVMEARLTALVCHFNGDFAQARECAERALQRADLQRRSQVNAQLVDGRVAIRSFLSRTLWLVGETDRALEMATTTVEQASTSGHSLSLCFALFGACPVALWSGEIERAQAWCQLMFEDSARRGLVMWHRWAQVFSLALACLRDARGDGPGAMLDDGQQWLDLPHYEMLVSVDPRWLNDPLIARAWCGGSGWCTPEVWRCVGERHAQAGQWQEAEAMYRRSLQQARAQSAFSWEARSAVSLAALLRGQGRAEEAAATLTGLCLAHPPARRPSPALAQARAMLAALDVELR